jgi:hypothetical protein
MRGRADLAGWRVGRTTIDQERGIAHNPVNACNGLVTTAILQHYAAGLMLWFMRKKFVGSYFFFKAASRS